MRDEMEGRKKQASSNKQGKATQHTQGSYFSKEKWAASGVTRTHDTLHSRQSTLPLSYLYQGSSAGWAQMYTNSFSVGFGCSTYNVHIIVYTGTECEEVPTEASRGYIGHRPPPPPFLPPAWRAPAVWGGASAALWGPLRGQTEGQLWGISM